MTLLVALHVLAAVIWVGGMFFAYMVLRPAAGPLEPQARLGLWARVFGRFFPWVWASIVALLASGYAMLFAHFGGFAGAPLHVNVMQALGIAMMLIFLHLYFAPWRRFSRAVETGAWPDAGAQLNKIRRIVAINLVLGLVTVTVGASGRFWT
jgi:uncharacterized membrane protein